MKLKDIHALEEDICRVQKDAGSLLLALDRESIASDVTRDDMGTLHVNVSIALRRLAELKSALEAAYALYSDFSVSFERVTRVSRPKE